MKKLVILFGLFFSAVLAQDTTTISTTNVTAPTSCSTNGALYSSSTCNVYYKCVQAMWNYYVIEMTCNSGEAYNSTSQQCEASSTCGATTTTVAATTTTVLGTTTTETATTTTAAATTTAEAVTAPSSCSTNGALYASSTCNAYYKCVQALWNYYVIEMTCASGQAYNATSQQCENSSQCS